MQIHICVICGLLLAGCSANLGSARLTADDDPVEAPSGHSVAHSLIFYAPNRVLDIFDVARLRVRVGPGIGLGLRATKPLSAYLGTYASIYAGLPGPRNRPTIKLPIGLESYSGVGASVVEGTVSGGIGPDYSPAEFGMSVHLLLVGFDFGFDPVEVVDFVTGLVFVDISGDDL